MQIFKTDTVTYKVMHKQGTELVKQVFSTFAQASGYASALPSDVTWFLDFTATSPSGDSSLSSGLYRWNKETNTRECIKPYYAKQLAELGK